MLKKKKKKIGEESLKWLIDESMVFHLNTHIMYAYKKKRFNENKTIF